jgi:hypothetical protein
MDNYSGGGGGESLPIPLKNTFITNTGDTVVLPSFPVRTGNVFTDNGIVSASPVAIADSLSPDIPSGSHPLDLLHTDSLAVQPVDVAKTGASMQTSIMQAVQDNKWEISGVVIALISLIVMMKGKR